ncbi:hypothetical protein NPIL_467641, partial [Nephila pilipes]
MQCQTNKQANVAVACPDSWNFIHPSWDNFHTFTLTFDDASAPSHSCTNEFDDLVTSSSIHNHTKHEEWKTLTDLMRPQQYVELISGY